jgi:hypothetical protein
LRISEGELTSKQLEGVVGGAVVDYFHFVVKTS